jgi:hypothetical protein
MDAMIARFGIRVPFNIAVPDGERFVLHPITDGDDVFVVKPPARSGLKLEGVPDSLAINERPAFIADVIVIDFHKESFDRRSGSPMDPSRAVVQRAVDSFVARFRYATRGAQVRDVSLVNAPWRLRYLKDDETELESEDGLVRGHSVATFYWSWVAMDAAKWESIHQLPPDFELPTWDTLRLDAEAALPHVGTCVILAAASLENFITYVLDRVALKAGSEVSQTLWNWIRNRGDHYKEPSVEEQFDTLLHELVGHSLKAEQPKLWESMLRLKTARNKFMHTGIAMAYGKAITHDEALAMLRDVNRIVDQVRDWLPEDLQWQKFIHPTTATASTSLLGYRGGAEEKK